jgi:cyanophycin synthetase
VLDLVVAENRRRAAAGGRLGMSPLTVDLDTVMALHAAGRTLGSVPTAGEVVPVKFGVNQSGAPDTETVPLGALSCELLEEVRLAARVVGLRLTSVEVVTTDPARSLRERGGVVLEVNGTPGLHYHYLVADPTTATSVAIPILACLLGEAS